MRFSTYIYNPSKASYKGLRIYMRYLYYHPHLPIMYPIKTIKVKNISNHSQYRVSEYKKNTNNTIENTIGDTYYATHDSDLERYLQDRISVNSKIHMMNEVIIYWDSKNQPEVSEHSNGA